MSQAAVNTKLGPREFAPTTPLIPTLSTPAAQALTHLHPLLLAVYVYLRFPSLVADPVSTLVTDLFPIATLQCTYSAVCLPVSKRSRPADEVKSSLTSKPRAGRVRSAKAVDPAEAPLGTRISNALLSLLLSLTATLPVYVLLILFGAPLTTHHPETLLLAAHFSLLSTLPLFYTHGVDKQAWWEIGGAMLPFDAVWGATVGTALGAWLGAVPIPLDWDRDWQRWPVTICAGMWIGWIVGRSLGEWVLKGIRMKFAPEPRNVPQDEGESGEGGKK